MSADSLPAARGQVQRFIGKMDFHAPVDQFAEVCPVPEIPGAAVDLVDDDADSGLLPEQFHHRAEDGTALFGRRFLLFKPAGNLQLVSLGVAFNGVFLLGKRYAEFALPGCRHPDVGKVLLHGEWREYLMVLVGFDLWPVGMLQLIAGIGKPTIHKVIDGAALAGQPFAHTQKHGEIAPQVGFGFVQFLFGEFRVEIGNGDGRLALHSPRTLPRHLSS